MARAAADDSHVRLVHRIARCCTIIVSTHESLDHISKIASRRRTRALKTYAALGPPNFPAVDGGGLMTSSRIFRPLPTFSRSCPTRHDQLGVFPEVARLVRELRWRRSTDLVLRHRAQVFQVRAAPFWSQRVGDPRRLLLITHLPW